MKTTNLCKPMSLFSYCWRLFGFCLATAEIEISGLQTGARYELRSKVGLRRLFMPSLLGTRCAKSSFSFSATANRTIMLILQVSRRMEGSRAIK
jgi:hypothetical protein